MINPYLVFLVMFKEKCTYKEAEEMIIKSQAT